MRRLSLAAAACAVALAGCAQFKQFTDDVSTAYHAVTGEIVTPQQVIIAANAFNAVKATATNYLRLPHCPKAVICRTPSASRQVIAWIQAGTADRSQLEAALRANAGQNLTLVDVYKDMRNTTAQLIAVVGH